MRRHARPRRDGSLRRGTGGPARRLPAIVLPAGTCDRHGHALHRQHAGRRHHAPLLRIFRHPRLTAPAAARRGIRRRVAARSGRLRLHARLRSLRKAPRGMVPARKGGARPLLREAARNRRQHRYRGAPHGAVVGRGNEIPRGTGGRIHRRMRRRPAAAQCPRGDEPPLRRRARKFDALPPRDGKPLEHRGRLPLYGRDAADRRRTGGEDPRARRDDAGAEPRRSPAHRRAAHHGRGAGRRADAAGKNRHLGHPSRGDIPPDRPDARRPQGIPGTDRQPARLIRALLGIPAAEAGAVPLHQPEPLLLRRERCLEDAFRPGSHAAGDGAA